MSGINRVLDSSNAFLNVTNVAGSGSASQFAWLPLGTVGGSATGEVGLKVIYTGGATGTSSQNTQGVLLDDAASATTIKVVLTGGVAVDASTYTGTYTSGDAEMLHLDRTSGGLLCHIRKLTAADDTVRAEAYSYTNITSAATTTVKSGSGALASITVNTTAAGTIKIYDNTAGSGTLIGTLKASVGEQTFFYNVAFSTGLTIVTAAASDITVAWR